MGRTAFESSELGIEEFRIYVDDFIAQGELQSLSIHTIKERKYIFSKLLWFIEREGFQVVGTRELKSFFLHLINGHSEPLGRFGNPQLKKPLRPVSLKGWYTVLEAWYRWLIQENCIESNPMAKIPRPGAKKEIKQPLSEEQVGKLIEAARCSPSPLRDTAIVLMLLDSGIRASELVNLRRENLDLATRSFKLIGKGNKQRSGFLGREATRAILRYLRDEKRKPSDYLFQSERGLCGGTGAPLKANGLRQLISRLAVRAGIEVQCSPHTLRRTFAVQMLRNGSNCFAVMDLMGHSTLDMTRRYCRLAEADLEEQHRSFSPADNLKKRKAE